MTFNESGSKYLRNIKTTEDGLVDVYAVLDAFAVTCPARQHAIKELLCSGIRGKGDAKQDLSEARDAVDRAIQLEDYDFRSEYEEFRVCVEANPSQEGTCRSYFDHFDIDWDDGQKSRGIADLSYEGVSKIWRPDGTRFVPKDERPPIKKYRVYLEEEPELKGTCHEIHGGYRVEWDNRVTQNIVDLEAAGVVRIPDLNLDAVAVWADAGNRFNLDAVVERSDQGKGFRVHLEGNPREFGMCRVTDGRFVITWDDGSESEFPHGSSLKDNGVVRVPDLNLDAVTDDQARALHRVVRAMHDAACPDCGFLSETFVYPGGYKCPRCGFTILEDDAISAIDAFIPFTQRCVEVFKKWRASRQGQG